MRSPLPQLPCLAMSSPQNTHIRPSVFQCHRQCKFLLTVTEWDEPNKTNSTTPAPDATCIGGTRYTVKQGDTCDSIAKANSLAIDSFLYLNNIDFGSKTLAVGNSVCIRDTCKTFTVRTATILSPREQSANLL